ncbi:MAG: PEGA domain-containing protein [Myxococcota bacterium]
MIRFLGTALTLISLGAVLVPVAEAQRPVPVNVESTPAGATVYVDATTTAPIGTTPLRNVRIPRGQHTLIFQLPNHEEGRLPVEIRRRRETFRIVLNPLGTLVVTAGSDSATGAAVRVDGQALGNVPFRQTVQPGRHLVQVGREGYVTFTQWVEVAGGQVMSLPVVLEREAPETGSILVAGDVSGAPVYVGGTPRGVTPTLIENVPAGEHQIEIRPDGMDVFRQTVRVIAGERVNLNPQLRPTAAAGGSIRVIANVPGATISLDGEVIGNAPASRENISPGEHILEASAQGYGPVQQPVTIESGQQRVVSLRLEPDAQSAGRIIVDANVGASVVTVDGEERGSPPVVVEGASAGAHTIVIAAEGYENFRHRCDTAPGRDCEVNARLVPVGTPVRVEANARGAELLLDGDVIGPIPYEGNLPVGAHRLEVRAPGYQTHVQQINLMASGDPRTFNIALAEEGAMTEEQRAEAAAERQREQEGATGWAAAALPQDQAVLDMSIGWIYPVELRLGVGILPWLEGGFAFRTMLARYNEFELRAQAGFRPLEQLSAGLQVRFGGGIGPSREIDCGDWASAIDDENGMMGGPPPTTSCEAEIAAPDQEVPSHSVNSVFFSVEAMGTLHFSNKGAFTLWMGLDIHSDGYDWSGVDSDILVVSDFPEATEPAAQVAEVRDGRQGSARFRLGGSLELVLGRHWNAWVLLEGVIGPSRDILGNLWGFGPEDTELYVRLGLTHKF